MMRARARRRAGWALVAASLGLHAFTVFCHTRQPDLFAAFLVVPLWAWGLLGLALASVAFLFLRANLSLVLSALWLVTILFGADEARVLAHAGTPKPTREPPSAPAGRFPIRVATINCSQFRFGSPGPDLAAWHPDIVLVQEIDPTRLRELNEDIYDGRGDYRNDGTSGVLTRWRIVREVRSPRLRSQQVTVRLPGGHLVEVLNVHLVPASPDARLWLPSCWRAHRDAQIIRRNELAVAVGTLEQTTPLATRPAIVGGDFNSPAGSPVYRILRPTFADSFSRAGRGWADTFPRRFPLHRIDRIFSTPGLTPQRCEALTLTVSTHRMVVADFTMPVY